jgi:Zn-dependent protease
MPNSVIFLFQLVVLIFSVMLHEISHGFVAEKLGDPTARNAGRLTLNPLKHIDPFGSIILPLILSIPALFGMPVILFGWAKPVPYNPMMLKNPKSGAGKIAAAGPLSNFFIAVVFGILLRLIFAYGSTALLPLAALFSVIVYLNIVLGVFNLLPIPPLDGSKVLFALLPSTESSARLVYFLERYGMAILLIFIFWGFAIIQPIINGLCLLIAGHGFGF